MAADTSEIDHLLELLEPIGPLRAKRMFGGWGIYAGGPMCALVADGELLLKVDQATRTVFEAAGSRPFVFHARGRQIPMSYWSVPEDALDSPEAMRPWAEMAAQAAARNAQGKPRKRSASGRSKPG